MNGIDLRRFEFDYDVTWNAFFLDERLNVYSRYGGRDEGDPERRLGKESLAETMRAVLDAHDQARKQPEKADPLFQPVQGKPVTPHDIPLLKQNHQGCVHCHQVKEYQLLQWSHDGVFDRRKLFGWPLPENLGLEIDHSHGRRVKAIPKDSAAATAGVQPGDIIEKVNDVPMRSEYDIRWMLHRAEDGKEITIDVRRTKDGDPDKSKPKADGTKREAVPEKAVANGGATTLRLMLKPTGDWRQTELGWRKSMRSVPLDFGFRGYALTKSQRKEYELDENRLAVRIISVRPRGLAKNLGLLKSDVVVAHGDATAHRTIEQFLSDLLRRHNPGDTVTLTVRRDGKDVPLSGKFPEWHTEETTVP